MKKTSLLIAVTLLSLTALSPAAERWNPSYQPRKVRLPQGDSLESSGRLDKETLDGVSSRRQVRLRSAGLKPYRHR